MWYQRKRNRYIGLLHVRGGVDFWLINQKPDPVSHLVTPALSPSSHPSPDSNNSPPSPHASDSRTVRVVNGEIVGMDKLSLEGKNLPLDLHGADVPGSARAAETPMTAATAGESAGTNYGPNLGFPFPNSEPSFLVWRGGLTVSSSDFWCNLSRPSGHDYSSRRLARHNHSSIAQ
jgi:hypothetical protein